MEFCKNRSQEEAAEDVRAEEVLCAVAEAVNLLLVADGRVVLTTVLKQIFETTKKLAPTVGAKIGAGATFA
jgi:hypothetical protein